VHGFSATST